MRVLESVLTAVFFMFLVNIAMAKSFTNNGNDTVTDNDTALVWQQGESVTMVWDSALGYCEGLSLGGKTGWRLPNAKELQSLTDYSKSAPALDANYFPGVTGLSSFNTYWTSTTYVPDSALAWGVSIYSGLVRNYDKSGNFYVRCVWDGQ